MFAILNAVITLVSSVIIISKESVFAFFSGIYSISKVSLGIAVPLAAI
jgi:hypothetical protein